LKQLDFFEPGPVACEWCGEPGKLFCSPAHRTAYEKKHGKVAAGDGAASGGVTWDLEPAQAPARQARAKAQGA
jgi:hypothetical protein